MTDEIFRVLDLYCGGGGTAVGYHQALTDAGIDYEITGIDNEPMPNYPFRFEQADAIDYVRTFGNNFDFIHASPPCEKYSRITNLSGNKRVKPDLLDLTRKTLLEIGKPFVLENVDTAPMTNYLLLCGTMFNLRVFRHRHFETYPTQIYFSPCTCNHWGKSDSLGLRKDQPFITVTGCVSPIEKARKAMGIDWMNRAELVKAVPPAYTKWIMKQLICMGVILWPRKHQA